MFTGLIEATGSVLNVEERAGSLRIAIAAAPLHLRPGDSVAVNGVCLTAVDLDHPGRFHADLAAETVTRTSLARLAPGSTVNLELPTPAGAPMGGHIVQGHVDGTGTLLSLLPIHPEAAKEATDWRLRIAVPSDLGGYMVEKGSIAIDGISLTIARWEPRAAEGAVVEIAVIPHTYAHTNLSTLTAGNSVNIEADIMLKFAAQRGLTGEFEITNAYLMANGY